VSLLWWGGFGHTKLQQAEWGVYSKLHAFEELVANCADLGTSQMEEVVPISVSSYVKERK